MTSDYERPSTWLAALGLGGAAALWWLLADLLHGAVRSGWLYLVVGLWVACAVLGLWHGLLGLLAFGLLCWDAVAVRRAEPAAPPADQIDRGDDDAPAAGLPDPAAEARAWAAALGRFFRAGDKAGFTIRALTPGVLSEADWTRLTAFYVSDDGRRVLRDRGGNQGTSWGYGWDLDGAVRAIGAGALPLPGGEPPVVEVYVADTTQRNAPRQSRSRSGAVVESQVVRRD